MVKFDETSFRSCKIVQRPTYVTNIGIKLCKITSFHQASITILVSSHFCISLINLCIIFIPIPLHQSSLANLSLVHYVVLVGLANVKLSYSCIFLQNSKLNTITQKYHEYYANTCVILHKHERDSRVCLDQDFFTRKSKI